MTLDSLNIIAILVAPVIGAVATLILSKMWNGKDVKSPVNPNIDNLRKMPSVGSFRLEGDQLILVTEDDGEADGQV